MAKRKTREPKFYWIIEGFDSSKMIFSKRVPVGSLTERQLESLLKALTAKAGLEFDEIVGAYATKRTKIYNRHLEIQKYNDDERRTTVRWCGNNPHFVARSVKD